MSWSSYEVDPGEKDVDVELQTEALEESLDIIEDDTQDNASPWDSW